MVRALPINGFLVLNPGSLTGNLKSNVCACWQEKMSVPVTASVPLLQIASTYLLVNITKQKLNTTVQSKVFESLFGRYKRFNKKDLLSLSQKVGNMMALNRNVHTLRNISLDKKVISSFTVTVSQQSLIV